MRNLLVNAVLLSALMLAGCSTMTITDDGKNVTIKTSATAGKRIDSVLTKSREALDTACKNRQGPKPLAATERPRFEISSVVGELKKSEDIIKTAKQTLDESKALLNSLFGAHSYTLTGTCKVTPATPTQR